MSADLRPAEIPLPAESALASTYASATFADAFAVTVAHSEIEAAQFARWVLSNSPGWLKGLLALRDLLVSPLGIKTSKALQRELDQGAGAHIGFFRVVSSSSDEVVVGEKDRHLDFQSSILVRRDIAPGQDQIVATTVVHCNNLSGRIYIRAIEPFHKMVVSAGLSNASKRCG